MIFRIRNDIPLEPPITLANRKNDRDASQYMKKFIIDRENGSLMIMGKKSAIEKSANQYQ